RARLSVAALSVTVSSRISSAEKVPVASWFGSRLVIVVVFPAPAPARMQLGPRTASTARRCWGLSPSKIIRPPYGAGGTDLCRVCDAGVPKPNGWGQNLRGQTQKRRSVRQAKPTYAEAELMRREHAKHVHAARKE